MEAASLDIGRRMPAQKPGRSKQDYSTPKEFIAAVVRRFGAFTFDLAATYTNTITARFFSPPKDGATTMRVTDSSKWRGCAGADALTQDWTCLGGQLWLNPPFGDIAPWAEKCASTIAGQGKNPISKHGRDCIFFLVPASVGSNWWAAHVHMKARVLFLNGRLSFDGKNPYPKDCALAIYGYPVGYEIWRWQDR